MKHNRKIRNFLLMPKVQLRYMYYLLALTTAPMLLLLTYTVVQFQRLRLESAVFDLPSAALTLMDDTLFRLSVAFAICLILVVLMVLYGTIVASHRFVGPMFVINRYIEAMKNGDYELQRELRKDDEMKETFALLKQLAEQLREKK